MSATMALSVKPMTNNTIGNAAEGLDCVVCGDRATGKGGHDPRNDVSLFEK